MGPVVLDTLHVELVANDHDFLGGASVNLSEKVFVTLVDKDLLQSWEEDCGSLDVPVDQVLVEASLSELVWLRAMHSGGDLLPFLLPHGVAAILKSLPHVLGKVHSSLVVEPSPCLLVELRTQEVEMGTQLLSLLTGELDFETWLQPCEACGDSEMELEGGHIGVVSEPEDGRSSWVPVVARKDVVSGILI